MTVERCAECGFDGSSWTDATALTAIDGLPAQWSRAIADLSDELLGRRPIPATWSIAEYTDHVRETVFGMRFVLETVLNSPGADLGKPPEPLFTVEPRVIDVQQSFEAFVDEVRQLSERLRGISTDAWDSWVIIDSEHVDIHWIARHAVHDVTHHILDEERLRAALE